MQNNPPHILSALKRTGYSILGFMALIVGSYLLFSLIEYSVEANDSNLVPFLVPLFIFIFGLFCLNRAWKDNVPTQ